MVQLSAYIDLLLYIKQSIECYLLPIDRIIGSVDEDILIRCGLNRAIDYNGLSQLINNADYYIDGEAIEILRSFANNFGSSYGKDQIEMCSRTIDKLQMQLEKLKSKAEKENKMRLTLSVSISVSIVLLLI